MPRRNHPPERREHFAQQRGFVWIECPIGRCPYRHRFAETDLTVDDAKTVERRESYLRQHHAAGHPTKRGRS